MKKSTCASLLVLLNIVAALVLEAAPSSESKATSSGSNVSERYDIMRRDEKSGTDALAIPLDESEVEDEEDINEYEKKNIFNLPEKK